MVREAFDGSLIRMENFQIGSGFSYFEGLPPYQRGYGGVFAGYPRQRGDGLGDIFKGLWRYLKPALKNITPALKEAGKAIGQEGLATSARVLTDVVKGGDLKEALATEGREGVSNLLQKAEQKIRGPRQRGEGRRRRKKRGGSVIIKPESLIGTKVPVEAVIRSKRQRKDIFGQY